MKRYITAAMLAGVLLFAGTAWADEPNKHDHSGMDHGTTQVQPTAAPTVAATTAPTVAPTAVPAAAPSAHDHNMTPEEHQNMGKSGTGGSSGTDSHSTHGTAVEPSSSSEGGHSHGSGEPLVETPANQAVLGTFGGIMGAFILYGAVTKLLRKKEGAHA